MITLSNTVIPLGWLSPDGEFYPLLSPCQHFAVAQEILGDTTIRYPDDALLSKGYVEITKSEMAPFEISVIWTKFLTDYQKNFLRPYFESKDNKFNFITLERWNTEKD